MSLASVKFVQDLHAALLKVRDSFEKGEYQEAERLAQVHMNLTEHHEKYLEEYNDGVEEAASYMLTRRHYYSLIRSVSTNEIHESVILERINQQLHNYDVFLNKISPTNSNHRLLYGLLIARDTAEEAWKVARGNLFHVLPDGYLYSLVDHNDNVLAAGNYQSMQAEVKERGWLLRGWDGTYAVLPDTQEEVGRLSVVIDTSLHYQAVMSWLKEKVRKENESQL